MRAKIALVTGASRGIGRQIALDLSKTGIYTICVARPSESLERLNKELQGLPGSGRTIAMNLDSENAATSLVDLIDEPIDIIIHNVGGNLGLTNPLGGSSEFLRVIAHNMALSIDLNAHFIPKMQERGWGRVCHISSVAAIMASIPSYSAAKASINSYVRGLGRYVAKDGVVVTSLMPGAILTEGGYWDQAMRERPEHVQKFIADRMAIGRLGRASDVSDIVMLVVSDFAHSIQGACILVDGGHSRVIQNVDSV